MQRMQRVSHSSPTSSSGCSTISCRKLPLFSQHLPRIQNALRIERALHCPHDVEFDRASIALELAHLVAADAVLGAEASAHGHREIEDCALNLRAPRQERFRGNA